MTTPPPPPPRRDRTAASAIALVLDAERLETALGPMIPDPEERGFIIRCIIGEGPIHHRAASYALIALAAELARRIGGQAPAPSETLAAAVPMRMPPHLATAEAPAYPLALDVAGIERIAAGDQGVRRVLIDAATDGPPHHALANVVLLNLLTAMLRGSEARP